MISVASIFIGFRFSAAHIRIRTSRNRTVEREDHTSSANYFWRFEFPSGSIPVAVIPWGATLLLRHVITEHYLKIDAQKKAVQLTDDRNDPTTHFQLLPMKQVSNFDVQKGTEDFIILSSCRIIEDIDKDFE